MSATVVLVLAAAGIAGVISGLVLFPVRRFAQGLGLLDRPGGHSSHTVPTPLGGGIGIYLGVAGTVGLALLAAWWLQDAAGTPIGSDGWRICRLRHFGLPRPRMRRGCGHVLATCCGC